MRDAMENQLPTLDNFVHLVDIDPGTPIATTIERNGCRAHDIGDKRLCLLERHFHHRQPASVSLQFVTFGGKKDIRLSDAQVWIVRLGLRFAYADEVLSIKGGTAFPLNFFSIRALGTRVNDVSMGNTEGIVVLQLDTPRGPMPARAFEWDSIDKNRPEIAPVGMTEWTERWEVRRYAVVSI